MVPRLTSERLILRPRDTGDIDAFVAMDSDPEVRRHLPPDFRDRFDAGSYRAMLEQRVGVDFGEGLGHWTLRLATDAGRFVGTVLLIPVEGRGPGVEIGWRLPKACWGQGYATEAARAVLAHAATLVAPDDPVALIHPGNAASIGVARRLGFARDGTREAYGTTFDLYRRGSENP